MCLLFSIIAILLGDFKYLMAYLEVSPRSSLPACKGQAALTEKLRELSGEDLEKVSLFIGWITKA